MTWYEIDFLNEKLSRPRGETFIGNHLYFEISRDGRTSTSLADPTENFLREPRPV
jgi:hypothetical protein